MVDTIKFSEFSSGGDLSNDKTTVGLDGTLTINTKYNNPWTFLAPGTTGDRPAPSAGMYYRLRFNTTELTYEYYDPISVSWISIEDAVDLLPLLASHVAGEGASLIGLQDQGGVLNKTVQDFANSTLIASTDNGSLVNGVFLNAFSTGFLASTIVSGALNTRVFTGTLNQVDVANGDGSANPVFSLSTTINLPGTFAIQSTIAIDAIINDSTLATATTSNVSTAAAMKAYIDSIATGLNVQGACVAASTTALTVTYNNGTSGVGATLTNADTQAAITLDGVSPTVGERVLIKNQASTLQNGIYTVSVVGDGSTNWVLTRATDFDTPAEIKPGDLVVLTRGTTQAQSSWLQTATVTAVGTDAVTFVQFTASLPVNVASGGTGRTTLTANSLLYGDGTNSVGLQATGTGVLTALGQNVTGSGSIALSTSPVFVTPTLGAAAATSLSISNVGILDSNGASILGLSAIASAVNYITISNNITANFPFFGAAGSDTNITLGLIGKGTGGVRIQGTGTNNTAPATYVGEYISASVGSGSPVSLTTATPANVTSISLTAGDWDISWGLAFQTVTTTSVSVVRGGLNASTAIVGATTENASQFQNQFAAFVPGTTTFQACGARSRQSLSGTRTIYLNAQSTFTIGTMVVYGWLSARRVR